MQDERPEEEDDFTKCGMRGGEQQISVCEGHWKPFPCEAGFGRVQNGMRCVEGHEWALLILCLVYWWLVISSVKVNGFGTFLKM